MKILVTGGAGFIGKHLIKSLLQQNHDITIFDNFSNSNKKQISVYSSMNVNVIDGDITNKKQILFALKEQQVVIHLAAKISVIESLENPQETMKVNVEGTMNVLEGCKENKILNVIIASSAAIFDDAGSSSKLLCENSKKNPISPYGKSKLIMEEKVLKFSKENKINCIIFRFFNIYGIGQTDEYAGVITKFISNIQNNKTLNIFGDGLQTRDFVSIEDVVNVIISTITISGKFGEVYNIGFGKNITIRDLADLILKAFGKKLKIEFSEPKKGEIRFSQTSIEKAKKELEYMPKISLKEGIVKMLEI